MLDTVEQIRSESATAAYDPPGAENASLTAQAMVPMLDWPTDLFNTFTAELEDDAE